MDLSSIECENMSLSEGLIEKIINFFKYNDKESILSEILAYMSYEANIIKIEKKDNYLIISGNDGGLNDGNVKVLSNKSLGLTTGNNISYFGAGSRTASKQWTEEAGCNFFGILDNTSEIFYKLGGQLGIKLIKNELFYTKNLKDRINLDVKDKWTYWILPWNNILLDLL